MFTVAYNLIKALAAIPSILETVKQIAAGIAMWYVEQSANETLKEIADAAAAGARAKTQEERYHALDLWRSTLSRPRVRP